MKLVKGKKAATPKGMSKNVKVMEKAGYQKKRAVGAAYGEVGMEKKARRDESSGMKKVAKMSDLKKMRKAIENADRSEDAKKYQRKKGK